MPNPPDLTELRNVCLGRDICSRSAFEKAVEAQRQIAEGGGRVPLLDVLVIQGAVTPEQARDLRSRGFAEIGLAPERRAPAVVVVEDLPPAKRKPRAKAKRLSQADAEPSAHPTTQLITQPVTQAADTPRLQPLSQPTLQPLSQQISQQISQEIARQIAQPPAQPISRPISRPISQAILQAISRPITLHVTEPAAMPVADSAPAAAAASPVAGPVAATTPPAPPAPPAPVTSAPATAAAPASPAAAPTTGRIRIASPTPDLAAARTKETAAAIVTKEVVEATRGFEADDLRKAMRASVPGDATGAFAPTETTPVTTEASAPPRTDESDFAPRFGSDFPGRTVAGCRLERELGRGAMGVVFEATHISLQRKVAVKVLIPSARRGQKDVEQFFQEARALARIEHQNIVQVYDVGEQDGLNYIVMQLLDGETVADRLDRTGKMPWEEACRLALGTARGLGVAHEKGIVHRDIKPENLFVTADEVVKIADFGLAAQAAAGEDLMAHTEVMGTPSYMSPEQIDGRNVDGRADLYSLGCTLYVLLTGKKPFDGGTAIEILLLQTKEVAPAVCRVLTSVPISVSQVVEKLMAKTPSARYQKAEDLAADLEKILGGGKPKVVVEIEDVMGRMQELMRAADQPRGALGSKPVVIITCAAVVVAAAATVMALALPEVEIPAVDSAALLAEPPEKEAAAASAKQAIEDTERLAEKLGDRIDLAEQQYEDLARRLGDEFAVPVRASRELMRQRFQKMRDDALAAARSQAAPLIWTDPLAAVQSLLAVPARLRTGPSAEGWAQDLERARTALRTTTGMTIVTGGSAELGADPRVVDIPSFLVDVFEVSNAEYEKFVTATGARAPSHWGGPTAPAASRELPVVGVTAAEADAFAKWAGKRLPTSDEWERAARGTDGRAYPWGPDFDPARCVTRGPAARLVPVMTYPGGAAPDGSLQMAGNAAEWTADPASDPTLTGCREVRGGSARSHPSQCTTYVRYWVPEGTDDPVLLIGFRCAKDLK